MSDSTNNGATMHNTISWTEIPCQDLERVKDFYRDVFSWDFMPLTQPNCPETGEKKAPTQAMFHKGPCHGSFVKVDAANHLSPAMHADDADKKKMAVTVTISVQSVDETLKAIEKAGGKVYKPKVIIPGDMGCIAYFLDSEKNVMGIWSKH